MVVARSTTAARELGQQIRAKSVRKYYVARVCGRFPENLPSDVGSAETDEAKRAWGYVEAGDDVEAVRERSREVHQARQESKKAGGGQGGPVVSGTGSGVVDDADVAARHIAPLAASAWQQSEYVRYDAATDVVDCFAPLEIVDYKTARNGCLRDGRPSLTHMRMLHYDAATDTSIVQCEVCEGKACVEGV